MLPTAALVIATFVIVQLLKPALSIKALPHDKGWSNNALRALVFVISYTLVLLNSVTQHRTDWAGAWALIPAAAAVAGLAIASYHILADEDPPPPPAAHIPLA